MRLTYCNRPVRIEITSMSRDPVDAYALAGRWQDTGKSLGDMDLDAIQELFAGEIQQEYRQQQIEAAADRDWDMER